MQPLFASSLKTRLYLPVLAAFVPVAILVFFVAEEQKAAETRAILEKTLVLARTAASEEDEYFASARDLLLLVSDAFRRAEKPTGRLSRRLAQLLGQSPRYAAVGILDADGRLIAAGNPSPPDRHYGDSDWFKAAVERGKLTVGPYHGERLDGEPVLYFALPVKGEHERLQGVAFTALKLRAMNRTLFTWLTELPEGSQLTLLDGDRGGLRYGGIGGGWTAVADPYPAFRSEITNRRAGTLSATDESGRRRIYAFAPVNSAFRSQTVTVVLEVPEDLALAASNRSFLRNLALLGASALLAVTLVWWAGETAILRRIRAIVATSRRLASGHLDARIGDIGSRDELGHLADVFDAMASSLQNRIEHEKRVMATLERSQAQLRRLAAYQNAVREQERIRIAREIHDQLGQSLTVLQMDLSWIKKHMPCRSVDLESKLSVMSDVIVRSLDDLHAVMAELRPVILDDFGLAAAIEWQMEEFQRRTGIHCRREAPFCEPKLTKDQATAVFRIFQETLTNVARHAGAETVRVGLETADGELVLRVRDDGRGITQVEVDAPDAYGLLGIRERLFPWSGSVSFEGRPGLGTCVTIRLPLGEKGNPS